MRMALLVMAAGTLLAGVAQANPNDMDRGKDLVAQRQPVSAVKVLYVCSEEERSWRAFSRDLGTPDFVTARQVRDEEGKAWTSPKCITQAELRRLTDMQTPAGR